MRSGYGRSFFNRKLPFTLGCDISGEVVEVGSSVRTLKVGQEVFGAASVMDVRGTYADYSILKIDELALKPTSITHAV